MNESTYMNDVRGTWGMRGFTMGVIVGAGIALLFAPANGTETRRKLGEATRKLGSNARHGIDRARSTVNDLRDDAKAAVEAGREAYSRSRGSHASGAQPPVEARPATNPGTRPTSGLGSQQTPGNRP